MANVPRAGAGTKHRGTLALRKILLYFQTYPGTDAASGIAGVDYVFKLFGKVASKGKTANDGHVELNLPAGSTGTLEIFGSKFTIKLQKKLEPVANLHGAQRRLSMLGYELGGIDGNLGSKTDRAILNFLADNNLTTDGLLDAKTNNGLTSKVGE
jgi:Putative peptidoglycan binding domain